MPVPCRSEDYVAPVHLDTAPVHGCEASVAFDDEAHGEGSVPMRGGGLVWHDELEACVDGVGCERGG